MILYDSYSLYQIGKPGNGVTCIIFQFQGAKFSEAKNSEYENLDLFLSRLESWTHKLYPKWPRETTLQKVEMLGKKNVVKNTLGIGSKIQK